MNFVSSFMAVFAVLGATDLILGNRLGLGKEFEKGFMLLGRMALSMIGMIIVAPLLGKWMMPLLDGFYQATGIDPSIFPAMLLANDMGGAPLSIAVAKNEALGFFNGLVVSSMMGCTISFTIPVVLAMTDPEQRKDILRGLLYGIATIPFGCIVAGVVLHLPITELIRCMLPLLLFSVVVITGLLVAPKISVRILEMIGKVINTLILIGLTLGLIQFMTGLQLIKDLDTYENAAMICCNAAAVMSGAFPFMTLLSKIFRRPMSRLGKALDINETSVFGFVSTLGTSLTTFAAMKSMDSRGVVLNAAFCVSAGFTLAGHLAFTLSCNSEYTTAVIVGKIVSGICAILLAHIARKRDRTQETEQ